MYRELYEFVKESNSIERIFREPSLQELEEISRFMALSVVNTEELIKFVKVYQPEATLRNQYGLNVRVGRYYPPFGGPEIEEELHALLAKNLDAYDLHVAYEKLHPFTDCNGRSGRALWAWKMKDISGGFLLNFYFQALGGSHGK